MFDRLQIISRNVDVTMEKARENDTTDLEDIVVVELGGRSL